MFRFLVPPIVFLLLKNFDITSDSSGYFSWLSAQDPSQRDALIASILFILGTAVAAAFVVSVAFFSWRVYFCC